MTTYNRGATTVALITAEETSERLDAVADLLGPEGWEKFRRTAHGRLLIDLVHDLSVFVDHYEDAAKQRAANLTTADHKGFANAMQKLMCPGSVEPLPDRARKNGAI